MKRWGPPFGFLLIALAAALYYQQNQASSRSGFPAPDFTLKDLDGRPYRLSDLRGKIVFLNVWATWCAPCRFEMPSMEALHRRLHGDDFAMLAISEDEDGAAAVRPFVQQMGLTFPVLLDSEGTVPPRYGVTGFPETFVIDREGRVIQHFIGPADWESSTAIEFFEHLMNEHRGATQASADHAHTAN